MHILNNNLRWKSFGLVIAGFLTVAVWILSSRRNFNWSFSGRRTVGMKDVLCASIDVSIRGGEIVRTMREMAFKDLNVKSKGLTKEGAKELYTSADTESHKIMTFGLRKAFPDLTVISEEKATPRNLVDIPPAKTGSCNVAADVQDENVLLSDLAVWIDPLDATQEYTENLTQYVTTMVCVAVKGIPTIGVIHRPFSFDTVWSWTNQAHSKNLDIHSGTESSKVRKVIVSRSHTGEVSSAVKRAFGEDTVVIKAGGAGYKTLAVVRGEADVYAHQTLIKKWDVCAGDAILRAVGGHMTDSQGRDIDYSASGNVKVEMGLLASRVDHASRLALWKSSLVDGSGDPS